MDAGLVAFFVIIALLLAFYALLAPTNTTIKTSFGETIIENRGGLFEKIVRPAVRNFLPQSPLALTEYAHKNDGVKALLARTGNPWRVSPEEYVAVRVLSILAGVVILTIMSVFGLMPIPVYYALPLGIGLGYFAPKALLDTAWAKRRRELRSTLPEALDLLRICLNAGYNFSNALKQTSDMLPPGTTRSELARMSSEIAAGRSLNESLNAFSYRCPTDGVEAFVRAISQANTTGSDISATLAYQSEETRAEYERIIETRAQRLQTTLFFPIILFLLPVLMILLFGPSLTGIESSL